MKKKGLSGKGFKFFLAIFCIILAIIFWYMVEYNVIDNLSALTSGAK